MLNLVKSIFGVPAPSGPTVTLAEFRPGEIQPLDDTVIPQTGQWQVPIDGTRSIPLFEYAVPQGTESCRLHYRMQIRSELEDGFVYLEMWCNLPRVGKFFSKGIQDRISGTTDWTEHEVPFLLRRGQRPDMLDLNLHAEGQGTVWIREVSILKTPMA